MNLTFAQVVAEAQDSLFHADVHAHYGRYDEAIELLDHAERKANQAKVMVASAKRDAIRKEARESSS